MIFIQKIFGKTISRECNNAVGNQLKNSDSHCLGEQLSIAARLFHRPYVLFHAPCEIRHPVKCLQVLQSHRLLAVLLLLLIH